jgi:microcystin-dependent protein
MATVTGFTSAREQAIEDGTVVSGTVNGSGDLILTKHDASTVNAGHVTGAQGIQGIQGVPGTNGVGWSAGMITPFAGAAAALPSGWLICDGSSVLRTTYATLFGVIGVLYGSVDGTHFNLPNLVNTFPRGVAATPAGTGGAATHTHPLSDAGAAAIVLAAPLNRQRRANPGGGSWTETHDQTGVTANAGSTTTSAGGAGLYGATDAGSSLPPYLDILYIIKT